ncbi:MAG TPA: flagellar hook-basal body complex protein [Candidatus Elarobacter sp.]|jgi:flagellar hook protein FlgE
MAFDSLFIGVSGLQAYQNQIDTISNNIANVGTTGFKGQSVNFQDMIYQAQSYATAPTQTTGGVNGQDAGLGVKIGSVDTNFAQGGMRQTGVNTNLALDGDGFFILRKPNGNGSPVYTRDGNFSLNANGLLYDGSSGMAVQGYVADKTGVINQTGTPGDITIPLGLQSAATGTGLNPKLKFGASGDQVYDVSLGGNLDQTQWLTEAKGVQQVPSAPGTGQPYTISTTIYDSLGNGHLAQITYTPDANGATAGPPAVSGLPAQVADSSGALHNVAARWKVSVSFADGTSFDAIQTPGSVNGAGVVTPAVTTAAPVTNGTIGFAYFDQNGQYVNTSSIEGAAPGQNITGAANVHVNNGAASLANGNQLNIRAWGSNNTNNSVAPTAGGPAPQTGPIGLDLHLATSLAGTASANVLAQNGFAAGILSNMTIGQDGTISGIFTNGQTATIGRVAVATFQNEQGLRRIGSSDFAETANSGLAQVGTASNGRYGSINSGNLEQSNVSIADEFTKMIAAQNAYQANSKSITTASENMQTVIQLIR